MKVDGTRLHIASVALALAASPAAAQDGGIIPDDCGGGDGWATSVEGPVPANIPAFPVDLYGPGAETGVLTLSRREASGDVPVPADITRGDAWTAGSEDAYTYVLVPAAPLEVGVPHVLSWTSHCLGGTAELEYPVSPAMPLPGPAPTMTATLIQTVRANHRWETFLRVDVEFASSVQPWLEAMSFRLAVDDARPVDLHVPFESTTLLRRDLSVICPSGPARRADIEEGTHELRAIVGGFDVLTPTLETTITTIVDCDEILYVHDRTEIPLTAEEIAALPDETRPPAGEAGGAWLDAPAIAADAGAPTPAPAGGCNVGHAESGALGAWMIALGLLSSLRAAGRLQRRSRAA